MPEAQALIERFHLKRVESESALFPVYESRDQKMGLVISGIGKVNAAAATSCLTISSMRACGGAMGWINFGISGCGGKIYGETILGGKVTDSGSERSWYPGATWPRKSDLPRRGVLTVERPVSEYPEDGSLVEMEAAGYYPIALRSSSVELVQVIKVVSDDPDHGIERINKGVVSDLCRGAMDSMEPWLDAFQELIKQESARIAEPPFMNQWTEQFHFSATQTHQLRRLLTECAALNGGEGLKLYSETGNARDALDEIRKYLAITRSKLSA